MTDSKEQAIEIWNAWRERAVQPLSLIWDDSYQVASEKQAEASSAPPMVKPISNKEWIKAIKTRMNQLEEMGILQYQSSLPICSLAFGALARSDRDRLKEAGHSPRSISGIAVAAGGGALELSPRDRFLPLNSGVGLRDGRLSLLIILDGQSEVVGMNIQLRGVTTGNKAVYIRFDRDAGQMGSGPVAHFRAHWHHGEDPELAEDPRLSAAPLDPRSVIDYLIEHFFPEGPESLVPDPWQK